MWRFVIQCSNHLGFNPCDLLNSHGDILKGHSLRTIVFTVFQGPILFILLIQFLGSPESYGKLLQKTPKMACSIMFRKLVISSLHPVQPVLQLSFSKMSCIPPKWKGFGHVMFFSQQLYFIIAFGLFILPCLEPCSMSFLVQRRTFNFHPRTLPSVTSQ